MTNEAYIARMHARTHPPAGLYGADGVPPGHRLTPPQHAPGVALYEACCTLTCLARPRWAPVRGGGAAWWRREGGLVCPLRAPVEGGAATCMVKFGLRGHIWGKIWVHVGYIWGPLEVNVRCMASSGRQVIRRLEWDHMSSWAPLGECQLVINENPPSPHAVSPPLPMP